MAEAAEAKTNRVWERIKLIFGLDTRSLAAMRIGLGVLILCDLFWRSFNLTAFHTDRGVMPREIALTNLVRDAHFSVWMASGTFSFAVAMFAITAVVALAFIIGYRTKLATIVLWVLIISLHNRNSIVLNSGDVVMRLMLFWGMFLPLGARWSIDALRLPAGTRPASRAFGAASVAYMAQICSIYVFTWLLKTGKNWWDGSAVYYALQIDYFATPVGHMMRELPYEVLQAMSYSVFTFELLGPILVLTPFFFGQVRTALVFCFVALHLGFLTGLEIGLFPWICMAAWAAFLPGWFWDKLKLPDTGGRPVRNHGVVEAIVAALMVFVLNWNLSSLKQINVTVPAAIRDLAYVIRLDQKWQMFAPQPLKDDGWYVMPGELFNGAEVELWQGQESVSFAKPALASATYPDQRWRKYGRNLWLKKYKPLRMYWGKYMCRTYNEGKTVGDRLERFEIHYVKELTRPPGTEITTEPVKIWTHNCFKSNSED